MSKPILDPNFWMQREKEAKAEHHAIFVCDTPRWHRIAEKHQEILSRIIATNSFSILDIGCGWGRLHHLLPAWWQGSYLGIDLCPTFIAKARKRHPGKLFVHGDFRDVLGQAGWDFDLAICISIRPMIKRELGDDVWKNYEGFIRSAAKKILYLEYDENDEGSLE